MSHHGEVLDGSNAELKAELDLLRAQLVARETELAVKEAELRLSNLRVLNEEAKGKVLVQDLSNKDDVIRWLLKIFLGPKSERRSWESLEPDQQLWLEGMALTLPESPPKPETTVKDSEKTRRKNQTQVLKTGRIKHAPEATVLDFDVPNLDIEGIPEDQLELVEIKTTERIVRVPTPYVIFRIHHKTYRRKGCLEELVPSELSEVLADSIYDVSFLAGLAVDKYQFHLPLYRQHQVMKSAGLFLDRGNLSRALQRTAELLEPIYEMLLASVLSSSVLAVDETPTPTGRKNGKMNQGYFWAFYGDQDEIFYLFSPTRATTVLDNALAEFQGHLVADGYAAYEKFAKGHNVALVQCWSHTRREFLKAEKHDSERAKWILKQIRLMYEEENKVRGEPPNKVLKARQNKIRPLVEGLFQFLHKTIQEETFVPSDSFLKAANYALNREEPLKAFLENPALPLDTNHLERELRPHAVGRKNWMFHVTEEGARHSAIFYSLIRSCILADIKPFVYLVDVLQRIEQVQCTQTDLLVPRLWKEHFGNSPITSTLAEALRPKFLAS